MIHPTAIVDPRAELGLGVSVGPWCLVDADVRLGDGVVLESRVHVHGGARIGAGTRIFDGAIIASDPQDLKYQGEPTTLDVGTNCLIREYCTVNRGTIATGSTIIGDRVLLMAYVHVAHDCRLGTGAVLANRVQLGGHVQIGEHTTIGGNAAVQQFCRIGAYSFVGGTLKVERDVPPASRALGNPIRWAGLNLHALRRHGFTPDRISSLEHGFRVLYKSGMPLTEAVENLLTQGEPEPLLATFFQGFKGGLVACAS